MLMSPVSNPMSVIPNPSCSAFHGNLFFLFYFKSRFLSRKHKDVPFLSVTQLTQCTSKPFLFCGYLSEIQSQVWMYFCSRTVGCVKHADGVWGWFWKPSLQAELGGVMMPAASLARLLRSSPRFFFFFLLGHLLSPAQERFWKWVLTCGQEAQSKIQGWALLTEFALLCFSIIQIAIWLNWPRKFSAFLIV